MANSGKKRNKPKRRESWEDRESRDMKRDSKRSKSRDYMTKTDPDNDASWYAANPQLLKDVASFPFGVPLGNRLNLGPYGSDINGESIPGIATIEVAFTYGHTTDSTSALNVASRNQYSWVRHANSGHANYDDTDLMLYYQAMDNVYAFIEWCKRLYGIAMTYSLTNRYYPKALIEANFVDFEDLQSHLSDFRAFINNMVTRAGSLCVPATMSGFIRHTWMFRNIYYDTQDPKAQTYMYIPYAFYYFSLDDTGKGCLRADTPLYRVAGSLRSVQWIMAYGRQLLEPILRSEDFGIMSGDTLKAFGEGNLIKLAPIAENYSVLPVYSVEVLNQIHNATLCGTPVWTAGSIVLEQLEGNGFYLHSVFSTNNPYRNFTDGNNVPIGLNPFVMNRIVDLQGIVNDAAGVMVSTRLCNVGSIPPDPTQADQIDWPTVGSEAATCMRIYRYADDGYGTWKLYESGPLWTSHAYLVTYPTITESGADVSGAVNALRQSNKAVQLLSQFEMHPLFYLVGAVENDQHNWVPITANQVFGDISNYTIINQYELRNLSDTALLSEYNVMQYGKVEG